MIVNIREFIDDNCINTLQSFLKEGLRIQVNDDVLEYKAGNWFLIGKVRKTGTGVRFK